MNFFSLHKNIKIRIVTSFITSIVGSMVFPFMAIYFSDRLGEALTGALLMGSVLLGMVVGFYGGYLADKIGRKKVMVSALVVYVGAYSLMAAVNSPWYDSVWLTFVLYTIIGISGSLAGPAISAMLIDSSTKENRTFMYSLTYWSMNVSVMIGSLLGGFFFKEHRFELFLSLAITSAFTLFMVAFIMTDEYIPKKIVDKVHVIRDIVNSYKTVIVDKAFIAFTFATVCLWSLENHGANYIAIRIKNEFTPIDFTFSTLPTLHLDGFKVVGFITTENTLLVVLFTMSAATLIRKFNEKSILYVGLLCYTVGTLFLGLSSSIMLIFVAGFIQTVGEIITTPIQSTIQADLMNQEARGAYSAFSSFSHHFCSLIGAFGITLYGWIGSYGMSVVIAISGFGAFILFQVSFKLKRVKEQESSGISIP